MGCLLIGIIVASFTLRPNDQPRYYLSDDDSLWTVYEKLGKIRFNAANSDIKGVSAERAAI